MDGYGYMFSDLFEGGIDELVDFIPVREDGGAWTVYLLQDGYLPATADQLNFVDMTPGAYRDDIEFRVSWDLTTFENDIRGHLHLYGNSGIIAAEYLGEGLFRLIESIDLWSARYQLPEL